MLKTIPSFAVLFVFISIPAFAQTPHAPGTKLIVTASKLSLRDAPSTTGQRIGLMPNGAEVTVVDDFRQPVPFESEGKKGFWVRVRHGDQEGYAFDGFMEPAGRMPRETPTTTTAPTTTTPDFAEPATHEGGWICVPGERAGPITATTSLENLKEIFGAANVKEGEFRIGEGQMEPATIIYPDTKDQVYILWSEKHKTPATVVIDGKGTRWRTESGITIGTPLAALEQMNGTPVHFTGFEWDYGGTVVDWARGRLAAAHELGGNFGVKLNVEPSNATQDAYLMVIGDDVYTSDMPAAKLVKPYVNEMTIGLTPSVPETPTLAKADYPNALVSMPAPKPGATYYVLATSLNMRETPALDAPIVGRLPYGMEIEIAEDSAPRTPLEIGGIQGHWIKVKSVNLEGYVFDAYLLPFPAPPNPTTGLWHYADTSFGKDGPEQLKSQGTPGSGSSHILQPYKYGARIDYINKRIENGAQRETRLTMQGISPEQAFLIAQRCIEGTGDMPFAMTPEGRVLIRTPKATVWILTSPGGTVAISEIIIHKGD